MYFVQRWQSWQKSERVNSFSNMKGNRHRHDDWARASAREVYQVKSKYSGLVIGMGGAGIRELKQMDGVYRVTFDTSNLDGPTHSLVVIANTPDDCAAVHSRIKARICQFEGQTDSKPMSLNFLLFHEGLKKVVIKPAEIVGKSSVIIRPTLPGSRKTMYLFSDYKEQHHLEDQIKFLSLAPSTTRTSTSSLEKGSKDWERFSVESLRVSLKRALKAIKSDEKKSINFNVSLGKYTFRANSDNVQGGKIEIVPKNGCISQNMFNELGITPIFCTALKRGVFEAMKKELERQGFYNENENNPESYTVIHLTEFASMKRFSVILALDENLEELSEDQDGRLSEQKKLEVERIYEAQTIGEVLNLQHVKNAKIAFRKLSQLVHPDKNCHPGATEAFKKVKHAFDEVNKGSSSSMKAIRIEQVPQAKSKPPKVVSVKYEKRRVANMTFITENRMDLRASLTTFKEDETKLSEHVRTALHDGWDKRDSEGGISVPGQTSRICINCTKQIIRCQTWSKSVDTEQGEVVILVRMKEMREKIGDGDWKLKTDWQECLEIDVTLDLSKDEKENISPDALEFYIENIRKLWESFKLDSNEY